MSTPTLGRLVKVDLRDAWTSEASAFTPWLAADENLLLLGEAIDIELEVEAQEKQLGRSAPTYFVKTQRIINGR